MKPYLPLFLLIPLQVVAKVASGHEAAATFRSIVIESLLLALLTAALVRLSRWLSATHLGVGVHATASVHVIPVAFGLGLLFVVLAAGPCTVGAGFMLGFLPVSTIPLLLFGIQPGPKRITRVLVTSALLSPDMSLLAIMIR